MLIHYCVVCLHLRAVLAVLLRAKVVLYQRRWSTHRQDVKYAFALQTVLEGGEFNTLSNKLCDIRDGARAHILAAEREDAEVWGDASLTQEFNIESLHSIIDISTLNRKRMLETHVCTMCC